MAAFLIHRLGHVARLIVVLLVLSQAQLLADQPLTKVSLQLDWYPQAEQGGYFYALVNGLYRKAGLDVSILPVSPNSPQAVRVALGQTEFGMDEADDLLMARARGLPLVAVMTTMQHNPKAIIMWDSSPVKSFADLEGRTVSANPGASWLAYVIKKYNLTHVKQIPLNLSVSAIVNSPDYIQECFTTSEPYIIGLHGIETRTLAVSATGCDPYPVVVTSETFLKRHPAVVQAFVSASREGWRGYLTDPGATDAEIIRRNPEMTQGLLDFSRGVLIKDHLIAGFPEKGEDVGLITEARMKFQYDLLRGLNVITQDYDYHQAYTTQFLNPPSAPIVRDH